MFCGEFKVLLEEGREGGRDSLVTRDGDAFLFFYLFSVDLLSSSMQSSHLHSLFLPTAWRLFEKPTDLFFNLSMLSIFLPSCRFILVRANFNTLGKSFNFIAFLSKNLSTMEESLGIRPAKVKGPMLCASFASFD